MKFGLALPYIDAAETARLAELAEAAGWDGVFVGDAIWCVDPMVALTAAAMRTHTLRLGTMVIPMPLRKPWKVASESAALDNLCGGRLTLGLGTGAVWMGWQGFPDEETDTRRRAEMLDEGIDILTLLYRGEPFDYDGQHYHLKLTRVDPVNYPRRPVQQPRIPLWVVGVWPRMKSMRRVLKCDGLLAAKMDAEKKFTAVTPADVREMAAYVAENRTLATPFDIIIEGDTSGMGRQQALDTLTPWAEAGTTWWIEGMWSKSIAEVEKRITQGVPANSAENS